MPKEQQACEQEQRSLCQLTLCACDCIGVVKGWGLGVKALDEVRVGEIVSLPFRQRERVGGK